jgi:hypothetical protein
VPEGRDRPERDVDSRQSTVDSATSRIGTSGSTWTVDCRLLTVDHETLDDLKWSLFT